MPATEVTYPPDEERQLREGGYLEGDSSTSPGSGAWGGESGTSSTAGMDTDNANTTIQKTSGPDPVNQIGTDKDGKPTPIDWDLIDQGITDFEKNAGEAAQKQVAAQAADAELGIARYYTAVQSKIYVNTTVADEIFGVTYQASCGTTPYYGYASKYFDAVVRGKCEIQGQILVYYNKLKYFWTLIKQDSPGPSTAADETKQEIKEIVENDSLTDEQKAKSTMDILNKTYGPKPPSTPAPVPPPHWQIPESPHGTTTIAKPASTPTTPKGSGVTKLAGGTTVAGVENQSTFAPTSSNVQTQEQVTQPTKTGTRQTSGPYQNGGYVTDETSMSSEELKSSNEISLQDKLDIKKQEQDAARALAEETEIDYAGPFNLLILTGNQTQDDSNAPLNVALKECFLTGKSRNYYQDDKILFTGYSFIARKEVDL